MVPGKEESRPAKIDVGLVNGCPSGPWIDKVNAIDVLSFLEQAHEGGFPDRPPSLETALPFWVLQ